MRLKTNIRCWQNMPLKSNRAYKKLEKPIIFFNLNYVNGLYIPFLFAGEKKLKTGENMVPNNVVLGGLPEEGLSSNLPFCFTC